jgi:predicted enzyme related to lactoylglutathione lyase
MENNTMKNAINWFEIPVTDLDRAAKFYESMLDTKLQRETMDGVDLAIFPMDETSVSGALAKADFMTPSDQGSIVYLNVEGIMDQAIERAQKMGSQVMFPKTSIGENGYIAHISDSEGNKIALHSMQA